MLLLLLSSLLSLYILPIAEIVGTYAVPYMYLQTPYGPGSGPPPPKGACPFRHRKDLEVVPHPQNVILDE